MAETLIEHSATTPSFGVRPRRKSTAETTLAIENMHCGGCLRKVETALQSVPGVAAARANLSTKRASVYFDGSGRDASVLIDALERAGFKAAELVVSADLQAIEEDNDRLRRLAVAGFASANIMLLSVAVWSGGDGDMSPAVVRLLHWLSALIALPTVAYAGLPFFRSAAVALGAGRLNMDVPISLGVILATAMSLFQTIQGNEHVYFDAAVTLLFFLLVGRAIDGRMRARSQSAAENLLGLRSSTATVIGHDGVVTRMSAHNIAPGMHVISAAGERFAVDGRVISGNSMIDESLISGETRPRSVGPGDEVYAGTVNLDQSLTIETRATSDGTLIAEIARLMTAAEQGRASYVRMADRGARIYAPAVHILGLGTFIGWLVFGEDWQAALTAAIAVLIITCPCALALAVPAVQVAAISRLFARGVLVKSPDALERLAEIDTVVFDKTGTLTRGEPSVKNVEAIAPEALAAAATLAACSRHPYARAVVRASQARGLTSRPANDVKETAGLGLVCLHDGVSHKLGSAAFCGAPAGDLSAIWYCRDGAAPVGFEMADRLRDDAAEVVQHLKAKGFEVELLSGDRTSEVSRVAGEVEIERFSSGIMPADKLKRLEQLSQLGHKTLMIGDGLNDAPALAAGHASLSPASAADISQTAADAIFQGVLLEPVLETLAVAQESRRMALQNFAIALGYNLIFVPLAVAGVVTPLIAAVAMSSSSIAVTLNAMRLRTKRLALGSWRSAP